jgi:phosphatidylserine decarboxylase
MSRRTWPEARRYVLPAVAAGLVLLPWRRRLGVAALAGGAAVVAFFRDPERPLDADPAVVYAAADGFVAGVDTDVDEPWLPGGSADRIRTFLSIHNVHVQRSPVDAVVTRQEAVQGGFAPALFGAAGENSRRRLALEGSRGPLVVVQIAGSIARTIACWVDDGERVAAGQRLGMIHFGSRTDVLLPSGAADVLVSVGDRVQAGVTPLARYRT